MALHIGISKRELFEDYYVDEIRDIFDVYSELNGGKERIEEVHVTDPEEFFRM